MQSQKARNTQGQETKQPQRRQTGKNTFQHKLEITEHWPSMTSLQGALVKYKCDILESLTYDRKHLLHVVLTLLALKENFSFF